jgi:hypothetical protein
MENIFSGPPSSGFSARVESFAPIGERTEAIGAALAALAAVGAVLALVAWGLGMGGALEGTALVLYAAQVASGVVIALGLSAHAGSLLAGSTVERSRRS